MKHILLIILIFVGSITYCYSQDTIDMIKLLDINQEVVFLEKNIARLIKKRPEIAKYKILKQFHIFMLKSKTYKIQDFFDYSFLNKLDYDYSKIKSQKIIRTITLITDSIGNLLAYADDQMVYPYGRGSLYLSEKELTKMLFYKELSFVFYLASPYSMNYMIGLRDNKLCAINMTSNGLQIYDWETFLYCCFDKWLL